MTIKTAFSPVGRKDWVQSLIFEGAESVVGLATENVVVGDEKISFRILVVNNIGKQGEVSIIHGPIQDKIPANTYRKIQLIPGIPYLTISAEADTQIYLLTSPQAEGFVPITMEAKPQRFGHLLIDIIGYSEGSGTLEVPGQTKLLYAELIGGGGGGGGGHQTNSLHVGTCGNPGNLVRAIWELPSGSIPWSVGIGGGAGGSAQNGQNGGDTTLGNLIAHGGKGGVYISSGIAHVADNDQDDILKTTGNFGRAGSDVSAAIVHGQDFFTGSTPVSVSQPIRYGGLGGYLSTPAQSGAKGLIRIELWGGA